MPDGALLPPAHIVASATASRRPGRRNALYLRPTGATDRAEDLAHTLEGIVLKHA